MSQIYRYKVGFTWSNGFQVDIAAKGMFYPGCEAWETSFNTMALNKAKKRLTKERALEITNEETLRSCVKRQRSLLQHNDRPPRS